MKSGIEKGKKGGRRSSGKTPGRTSSHNSTTREVEAENYHSIFSFSENELETVLNMFQNPVEGPHDQSERGYGFLQDRQTPPPGYSGQQYQGQYPGAHTQGFSALGPHTPHHSAQQPLRYPGEVPTVSPVNQQYSPQQHNMWYGNQHPMQASGSNYNPPPGTMRHAMPPTTNGVGSVSVVPVPQPLGAGAGQAPGPAGSTGKLGKSGSSSAAAGKSKTSAKSDKAVTGATGVAAQNIPQQFLPKKTSHRAAKGVTISAKTGQVSHSVAEKQRRDRINTLIGELSSLFFSALLVLEISTDPPISPHSMCDVIDELRELVPIDLETAEPNQPYGDDPSKRPKHVVLSDTIKFVRNTLLKQQERQEEQVNQRQQRQRQEGQEHKTSASPTMAAPVEVKMEPTNGNTNDRQSTDTGSQCSNGNGHRATIASTSAMADQGAENKHAPAKPFPALAGSRRSNGSVGSDSSQDSMDTNDRIEICVSQLEADETYSVNVNGKDRNGLLHDITSALKSMELEIKTAVIKTENSGIVNDTFEVINSYCSLSAKEIENQLAETLSTDFEVKRKRTVEEGDKRKRADAL